MWYLIGALVLAFIGYEIYAVRQHGRPVFRGAFDGLGTDIRNARRAAGSWLIGQLARGSR
ncbi:MAG: hypothetical protein JWO67_4080 [Streptosporangiaceae bacterium]|nr:hypothetical protein [Streptosporangiaceae bacterium]